MTAEKTVGIGWRKSSATVSLRLVCVCECVCVCVPVKWHIWCRILCVRRLIRKISRKIHASLMMLLRAHSYDWILRHRARLFDDAIFGNLALFQIEWGAASMLSHLTNGAPSPKRVGQKRSATASEIFSRIWPFLDWKTVKNVCQDREFRHFETKKFRPNRKPAPRFSPLDIRSDFSPIFPKAQKISPARQPRKISPPASPAWSLVTHAPRGCNKKTTRNKCGSTGCSKSTWSWKFSKNHSRFEALALAVAAQGAVQGCLVNLS